MEKEKTNLENVSGGAGAKKCYCVQGYSKSYGREVKLFVSTYELAQKLCEQLGLDLNCIKEVTEAY